MARKFSLAYLTIPGVDPVSQIKIAKEAGYDYVSLRTIPMHLPGEPEFLPQKDPELFDAIKKALKEYDMPLMDIELARVRPDLDIEVYRPAFEAAAKLGATDVLGSICSRDKAWYTDTAREARFYPGEGVMDIAGMVKAMPEIPLSIELPNLKEIEARGQAGHAARCLETAKAYFKANGIE